MNVSHQFLNDKYGDIAVEVPDCCVMKSESQHRST